MEHYIAEIERLNTAETSGKVVAIKGLLVEVIGMCHALAVGARCKIVAARGGEIMCEAVGFREDRALLMPFADLSGVGPGARVVLIGQESAVYPSDKWLGRIVNAMGEAIDEKGVLPTGSKAYALHADPPQANLRQRVEGKIDLGVRAINTFLTCCRGQRLGIFSGSGVGKSILLSMLAKYSRADVNIIGLVGERGREVQEFIEDDLGEEGLSRSIVVAATSSESALMRRQAAYMTMSLAEYFCDQGKDVLCIMDSVTRFAMAQREIGLSAGEPPTSKGYTPTVFSELPKLLERAGPGTEGQGSITGMFSVLVEGDDTNEPISDTVRGIIDGHIVLDRNIAQRGRFPAINILKSISRSMPDCNSDEENELVLRARNMLATYDDMAEMIRLGAYRKGTNPEVDQAIDYFPVLETFISQGMNEQAIMEEGYARLAEIMNTDD